MSKPPISSSRDLVRKGRTSKKKLVKQRKSNAKNQDSIEILSTSYKTGDLNIDTKPYQNQLFSYT
jgi:hypothetical protein